MVDRQSERQPGMPRSGQFRQTSAAPPSSSPFCHGDLGYASTGGVAIAVDRSKLILNTCTVDSLIVEFTDKTIIPCV